MTRFLKNMFKLNPIVVKEIRSRMRGPRAFITLTAILLLMGGLMYAMLQIILANSRYSNILSPQIGQALFAALAFLELFMICAVTPAITAGAISGEKEKQTYEMLMATPLSGSSILWGKLISALSYVLLLLFAGVPLASIVFIFGGVAPGEMAKALLVLIGVAIAFGILGLFMSALFGRTGRATVASFVSVALLMIGPIFLAALVGVLRSSEPPRILLAPSPISALSAALAPSMSQNAGGSVFYALSGLFNLGVAPVSQVSIPRPLYHYTIPFYALLSLILILLTTRLVQPTRRWRMPRRQLLLGIGSVMVLIGLIVGGYFATARRYEWAGPGKLLPTEAPAMGVFTGPMIQKQVVIAQPVGSTPTPVPTTTSTPTPASPPTVFSEEDQAGIYAAIVRQYYTIDHTFGNSAPEWPELYLINQTIDGVGDPNAPKNSSQPLSETVQAAIAKQVSDLPTVIVWVASQKDAPVSTNDGSVNGGKGAIITLGNIYPQKNGAVQVSASVYFGNVGGAGKTYILEKVDGVWKITGKTGVEWIS